MMNNQRSYSMKYLVLLLVLIGFSGTTFAEQENLVNINPEVINRNCVMFDTCITPSEIMVCNGSNVTWVNHSTGLYRIASGHVYPHDDNWGATGTENFWSEFLPTNQTFSQTFTKNGIYEYYLYPAIFPNGKIIVDSCNSNDKLSSKQQLDNAKESKFEIDGFEVIANSTLIANLTLHWDSIDAGKITLEEPFTGKITLQIPKDMPRATNQHFGHFTYYAMQTDGTSPEISETSNQNYYVLTIPVKNSDSVEILGATVATGMIVIETGNKIFDPSLLSPLKQYQNGVSQKDLLCQQYLVALFNIHGKFGCVTYDNGQELVKRGWANCEDQIGFRRGDICGVHSSPGIIESPEIEQKEIVRSGSSMPDYPLDFLARVSLFVIMGTVDDIVFLPLHYDEVGVGNALTAITINVEKDFNEKYANDTITVVIQGGETDTTKYVSDSSPEFAIGEKVIVFVADKEPESIFGDNYYVAGLEQGKFNLDEDGEAINKDPNKSLTLESLIGIINRIHSDE